MEYVGKIFLCALSLVVGTMVGGMFSTALRLEQPQIPRARWICGCWAFMPSPAELCFPSRWPNCADAFREVVGRALRSSPGLFTRGWESTTPLKLLSSPPSAVRRRMMVDHAVFVFVRGRRWSCCCSARRRATSFSNASAILCQRTTAQWAVRLAAAVLAFPLVYFFFGMPVGLMVGKFYQQSVVWPSDAVLGCRHRRAIHPQRLLPCWPCCPFSWSGRGSRQRFAWTFGLNLFVVSGLYGLIQAYWMPWTMRSVHLVELLLDSVVYGWLVAVLLLPRAIGTHPVPVEETGVRNYTI